MFTGTNIQKYLIKIWMNRVLIGYTRMYKEYAIIKYTLCYLRLEITRTKS